MILRATISALLLGAAAQAQAQPVNLEFPALAVPVAERYFAGASYFLPTAPYVEGPVAGVTPEGDVLQKSWKIAGGTLTTLQILAPLRAQLAQAGFEPVFECEAKVCGGFDFRYQMDMLPEPDMHVNLGDFRYLAVKRSGETAPEYIALVVSRSANAGFVQLTRIGPPQTRPDIAASTKAAPPQSDPLAAGPVGKQLELAGHATLADLYFETGSSQLEDKEFASLANLAAYLSTRPDRRIVLVGHTDSEGSLDRNIVLSRKRATAVMDRLIHRYNVSPDQVSADGIGYLAPRASNLTEEGRTKNRRVEVILTSTQ